MSMAVGVVVKRVFLPFVVAVALGLVLDGDVAWAGEPWWHVNTFYAPASKAGGEGTVDVEVSNLGTAPTLGTWFGHLVEAIKGETEGFVFVTEKLPAGLTVSGTEEAVQLEGGGTELGRSRSHQFEDFLQRLGRKSCSVAGQTVSCEYGTPVRPYERIILSINVVAGPGASVGVSEASVLGGGAAPVVSRRMIDPSESVPSYGIENYELTPEEEGGRPDTQAGSHPFQLTSTFALNMQTVQAFRGYEEAPGEGLGSNAGGIVPEAVPLALTKDLRFDLPAGLIGNPTPLPKCSLYVFTQERLFGEKKAGAGQCPPETVVGVATSLIVNTSSEVNIPYAISEPLYSLQPNVGEPARFGFQTPAGPVILDTSVRTGGDYGVVVTVRDIVDEFAIIGSQVTFWGVPADRRHDVSRGKECLEDIAPQLFGGTEISCSVQEKPQPFLIMPTSCAGPMRTTVEADSWSDPGAFTAPNEYLSQSGAGGIGEQYALDGCNRLSFEPTISVAPDGQQASTPTGLTVGVHVAQEASLNPKGLADATVKDTTVTLPAGVVLNPADADGLLSCGLGEIGLESPQEQSCPEASKVGTVEIRTPLLPNPLVGAAYLAQQNANPFDSLLALYVVAKDPVSGVIVKLAGQVTPDPVTGQLTSTFKDSPQLPFEDFRLHFFGGSRAPLATPALCDPYSTTASFVPWSETAPVESSSQFEITSGPNHSPCSDPLPFDPELTSGSLNIQAGAFTPFTMTMSREDGNQNLDAIQLKMPPGLLGTISTVKLCGEANANAGTCGPESLIGETIVSVGLGGTPYTVRGGKVYITGAYAGAPYGLSIVNPAKAGPLDLGQVVVRAKIEVDPTTAALTIASDTSGSYRIPQIIDGIPLQIKHINVTVDRPGFVFNPTNCTPMQIGGSLTSDQGAVSTLHVAFQVTNCATLKFKPIFTVSTSGRTSRARGANLHVKLTYPKAPFGSQANIGKVKVELPRQLPSRLSTLQKACPDTTFDQNPAACPSSSRVGSATATTPILTVPLQGPAYFVSHGGQKFPELIITLSGNGVTVYLHGETFISKTGITTSTFNAIPDVPVGTFNLNLPQGPYSALAANGNLCTHKLQMPTTFVAANGRTIHQNTHITVTNCRTQRHHHKKHKHINTTKRNRTH
jgi:hypothetical protein